MEIVSAALRVLDRAGAQDFSMRALATELGVSAMTVYNYLPTKALLLEKTVDSVIDPIRPPDPDAHPWDAELRRYALDAWRAQLPHPWIPALLSAHGLDERPAQARAREALLGLFQAAGAGEAAARDGVTFFFTFMIGSFAQLTPAVTRHSAAHRDALFERGLQIMTAGLRSHLGLRD
ncbi:hypothetical protein BCD48_25165 [Pseudofrankia sp. BMG5.36]|nr:hypothetical protein BCD48_25165 [Pseudofrankia sp. BMG5.36]